MELNLEWVQQEVDRIAADNQANMGQAIYLLVSVGFIHYPKPKGHLFLHQKSHFYEKDSDKSPAFVYVKDMNKDNSILTPAGRQKLFMAVEVFTGIKPKVTIPVPPETDDHKRKKPLDGGLDREVTRGSTRD